MIRLLDLRYLTELARTLHFGRAAEYLGISQPALSKRLKHLESELGVVLFERSTRGIALTDEGERVLHLAKEILRLLEQLRRVSQSPKKDL